MTLRSTSSFIGLCGVLGDLRRGTEAALDITSLPALERALSIVSKINIIYRGYKNDLIRINLRNQQDIVKLLINFAFRELITLKNEFNLEFASDINHKSINKTITQLAIKVDYSELGRVNPENIVSEAQVYLEGKRFEMFDIAKEQRIGVEERWNAGWESATEKFYIDDLCGWRFSNKVFWEYER